MMSQAVFLFGARGLEPHAPADPRHIGRKWLAIVAPKATSKATTATASTVQMTRRRRAAPLRKSGTSSAPLACCQVARTTSTGTAGANVGRDGGIARVGATAGGSGGGPAFAIGWNTGSGGGPAFAIGWDAGSAGGPAFTGRAGTARTTGATCAGATTGLTCDCGLGGEAGARSRISEAKRGRGGPAGLAVGTPVLVLRNGSDIGRKIRSVTRAPMQP